MAQWEAKNSFAHRHSGMASVFGANNGLSAGSKPTNTLGMAMDGTLGQSTQNSAFGARSFTDGVDGKIQPYSQQFGNNFLQENWGGAYSMPKATGSIMYENTAGHLSGFKQYTPKVK